MLFTNSLLITKAAVSLNISKLYTSPIYPFYIPPYIVNIRVYTQSISWVVYNIYDHIQPARVTLPNYQLPWQSPPHPNHNHYQSTSESKWSLTYINRLDLFGEQISILIYRVLHFAIQSVQDNWLLRTRMIIVVVVMIVIDIVLRHILVAVMDRDFIWSCTHFMFWSCSQSDSIIVCLWEFLSGHWLGFCSFGYPDCSNWTAALCEWILCFIIFKFSSGLLFFLLTTDEWEVGSFCYLEQTLVGFEGVEGFYHNEWVDLNLVLRNYSDSINRLDVGI